MQRIRKAVIPAAGFGTRFLPITKVIPKELLPVGNRPAIQYVVEEAVACGVEEIILVCHPNKLSIADYFKPDSAFHSFLEKRGKGAELSMLKEIESLARFRVVYQTEPLGLGHAVLCAREAVGKEPFLVLLPDELVVHEVPASRQLQEACGVENRWGVLLERVPREKVSSYGIIEGERTAEGIYTIRRAVEKPSPGETGSDLALMGRYLFPPEIFSFIEGSRAGALGEVQLTDAIDALAGQMSGIGVICQGKIFDVGTPEGLLKAADYGNSQRSFIASSARAGAAVRPGDSIPKR